MGTASPMLYRETPGGPHFCLGGSLEDPSPMGNLNQKWVSYLRYLASWREVEFIPDGSNPETLMTILPKIRWAGRGEKLRDVENMEAAIRGWCDHPWG